MNIMININYLIRIKVNFIIEFNDRPSVNGVSHANSSSQPFEVRCLWGG